ETSWSWIVSFRIARCPRNRRGHDGRSSSGSRRQRMHPASRRADGILVAAVVLSAGVTVAAVLVGTRSIAWLDVLRGLETNVDADIVWRIRLPRVCLGFASGAVLAVSGLALQAVFRNPLATPYTLGISSGASVG